MDVKCARRGLDTVQFDRVLVWHVLCMKSWVKSQHHSQTGVVGSLKCRTIGFVSGRSLTYVTMRSEIPI